MKKRPKSTLIPIRVWFIINTSKIMICFWRKPILRTHRWSHRCSPWSIATSLKFYHNTLNAAECVTHYHSNSRNPRQPNYLIHQRLKITKVSPTKPDDTAEFFSWEYRRSRKHQWIYSTAHDNNNRNVAKNALNSTTISCTCYRNHEIKRGVQLIRYLFKLLDKPNNK